MKCKDCILFRPSELNKEWGTCSIGCQTSNPLVDNQDNECDHYKDKEQEKENINTIDEYIRDYSKINVEDVLNKIDKKILKMVESKVNSGEIEKHIKDIIILQKAKNIIEDCLDEIYEDEIYEEEWEGEG